MVVGSGRRGRGKVVRWGNRHKDALRGLGQKDSRSFNSVTTSIAVAFALELASWRRRRGVSVEG